MAKELKKGFRIIGNMYAQPNDVAPTMYDIYEFDEKGTEKKPNGKMRTLAYGVPLDRGIQIIAHKHAQYNAETLEEFISIFMDIEKDIMAEATKLVRESFRLLKERKL